MMQSRLDLDDVWVPMIVKTRRPFGGCKETRSGLQQSCSPSVNMQAKTLAEPSTAVPEHALSTSRGEEVAC